MFESIKGIKIEGGCFEQSTTLSFFENKKDDKKNDPKNIAIIYGSNGSGKSTIANAFLHYKNSTNKETFSKVELLDLDKDNKIIKIQPDKDKLDKLHIFNEKFINDNVRFAEDDKLNTIVLLGEEIINLEEQISKLKEDKDSEEIDLNTYEKNEEKYNNNDYSTKWRIFIIEPIRKIALDLKNDNVIDNTLDKNIKKKIQEINYETDIKNFVDEIKKNNNTPIESYNSYQNIISNLENAEEILNNLEEKIKKFINEKGTTTSLNEKLKKNQ